MKSFRYSLGLCAAALALFSGTGVAAHAAQKKAKEAAKDATAAAAGKLEKITDKEAAWAAKQRATYPMTVCLTSDEKLGSMGDNAEFIYRAPGKPDRLLIFCCDGCEEDFLKEPAKYLAKLDAAAKGKAGGKKAADTEHKGHH